MATAWSSGAAASISQTTLPHGTPHEVEAQVRERLAVFAPGGGYVFSPVHNILADVPVDNILAAYQTAYQFGLYPVVQD